MQGGEARRVPHQPIAMNLQEALSTINCRNLRVVQRTGAAQSRTSILQWHNSGCRMGGDTSRELRNSGGFTRKDFCSGSYLSRILRNLS